MARRNRSFEFEIFDSPDGAYAVFENSLRSGMEYDVNTEDQFDAVVLTRPVKVTYDPKYISFKTDDNPGSEKFAFMVRVLGDKSPHKFLPNPCLLYELNTADAQRRAFNLIQQHTKVIMQADNDESLPGINSIVRVVLERNKRGSFKTDITKQFISIVNSDPKPPPNQQTCQTLIDMLEFGDVVRIGEFGEPVKAAYVGAGGATILNVENGKLEEFGVPLVALPDELYDKGPQLGGASALFIPEVIPSLIKVMEEYMNDHGGKKISISAHYRNYDEQVAMKEKKRREGNPSYAANPGHSMHGWGVAFDVNGTLLQPDGTVMSKNTPNVNKKRFDSPIYTWLDNKGKGRHGWKNPTNLRKESGEPIEAWHWENVALRKKHFPSVPPTPPGATTDAETTPEDDGA